VVGAVISGEEWKQSEDSGVCGCAERDWSEGVRTSTKATDDVAGVEL
jgi:hypothetical protein